MHVFLSVCLFLTLIYDGYTPKQMELIFGVKASTEGNNFVDRKRDLPCSESPS